MEGRYSENRENLSQILEIVQLGKSYRKRIIKFLQPIQKRAGDTGAHRNQAGLYQGTMRGTWKDAVILKHTHFSNFLTNCQQVLFPVLPEVSEVLSTFVCFC